MAKKRSEDDFEILPEDTEPQQPEDEGEVTNAAEVPLFAGAGFVNNRSIATLRLVKLDNPGAGYKGQIPLASTLETIGQLFGDGLYNIEAVNGKGRLLRKLENQRIALGLGPADGNRPAPAPISNGHSAAELDRIERLATSSASERAQQSNLYTQLVRDTTLAASEREREFMTGVQQHSQAFMAGILQAQAQGFQQLMAMMTTGHQQMMQSMVAAQRMNGEGESSTERMLALFMQGMNLGRGLDAPDEQPFWQELLRGGAQLLGGARVAQLSAGAAAALPAQTTGAKRIKQLKKLAAIQKLMRAKGIDPDDLLRMLQAGGSQPTEPEQPEEDSAEESDSGPERLVFTGGDDSEPDTE